MQGFKGRMHILNFILSLSVLWLGQNLKHCAKDKQTWPQPEDIPDEAVTSTIQKCRVDTEAKFWLITLHSSAFPFSTVWLLSRCYREAFKLKSMGVSLFTSIGVGWSSK